MKKRNKIKKYEDGASYAHVFTEPINTSVTWQTALKIREIVRKNKDLYSSPSHFVRVAVHKQIRKDEEELR